MQKVSIQRIFNSEIQAGSTKFSQVTETSGNTVIEFLQKLIRAWITPYGFLVFVNNSFFPGFALLIPNLFQQTEDFC